MCRLLDSAAGVGYWTDYLKTFLHPRSLYQLPGVWQGQGRFGAFGEGKGLLGVSETRDEIMDRMRFWAEECDTLQVSTSHTKSYLYVTYLSACCLQSIQHILHSVPTCMMSLWLEQVCHLTPHTRLHDVSLVTWRQNATYKSRSYRLDLEHTRSQLEKHTAFSQLLDLLLPARIVHTPLASM